MKGPTVTAVVVAGLFAMLVLDGPRSLALTSAVVAFFAIAIIFLGPPSPPRGGRP